MRTILKTLLLHAVILCATQTSGVHIESDPVSNGGLITTELNTTVSLRCRHVPAGESAGEVVWLRNGSVIRLQENNRVDNSSICVTPVTHEDNGAIFTCYLKKNATVKASVTLDVTYPPRSPETKDVFVKEQEVLLLQCDVQANPPVSVLWLYNGSLLEQSASKVVVTSDGLTTKLRVERVDRALHEGTYKCEIRSSKYGMLTGTFEVTVNDGTMKFPLMPMVAGIVVVILTTILAAVSRRKKIAQCFK